MVGNRCSMRNGLVCVCIRSVGIGGVVMYVALPPPRRDDSVDVCVLYARSIDK
jgi:hypothetical protein